MKPSRRFHAFVILLVSATAALAQTKGYFPAKDKWQRKAPAEAGMDAAKLKLAIEYAQANGSSWDFDTDMCFMCGSFVDLNGRIRQGVFGFI